MLLLLRLRPLGDDGDEDDRVHRLTTDLSAKSHQRVESLAVVLMRYNSNTESVSQPA